MAVDHIRYDLLAQEALRGIVRTVLADAAKNGLPGEHHFYISFDTRADGVRLSPRMLAQWPQEMTIVLQHQFWDLAVHDDAFEVGLSFSGVPERLLIPYDAITTFFDPVSYTHLEQIGDAAKEQQPPTPAAKDRDAKDRDGKDRARPPAEHKPARKPPALATAPTPANPEAEPPAASEGKDKPASSGEVVRLDRFRKK